jgi:hypothetical protein
VWSNWCLRLSVCELSQPTGTGTTLGDENQQRWRRHTK